MSTESESFGYDPADQFPELPKPSPVRRYRKRPVVIEAAASLRGAA